MIQARWLIIFFAVLGMSVPSFAIDWSLGGFPSYLRTRARVIDNAVAGTDDMISVVDTTLRLTPQLGLSDAVTVRAQVDVASNMIWGGSTAHFFGGTVFEDDSVVLSDLRPSDRFNGAILTGPKAVDDDYGFFTVRMLHADIVLPNNLGFVRIGRQPFDWGLGILANGGHDPHSDLGFVVDRALWLKSFPAGAGTFTLVLVSDVFSNGSSLFAESSGVGYDILAAAGIYNQQMGDINVTIGAYGFPYLHQNNIFSDIGLGDDWDVDRTSLYSGLLVLKAANWSFTYEVQVFGGGEVTGGLLPDGMGGLTDLNALGVDFELDYAFDMAGRLEFHPSMMAQVSTVGIEAGWAQGDDGSTPTTIEGNALPFSPAYNVDNLLFKHVIPTVYNIEGSVINAIYARAYANVSLAENLGFTPQVLIAWNDETNAVSAFDSGVLGEGIGATEVAEYLGTEVEGTLTWTLHPGVNLDLIGSLVIAGDGLTDLLEAKAGDGSTADDTIWAFQSRLMVYIDQFIK